MKSQASILPALHGGVLEHRPSKTLPKIMKLDVLADLARRDTEMLSRCRENNEHS